MPTYEFTNNASITELERQRMIRLDEKDNIWAELFPLVTENADSILWDIRDDVAGLMNYVGPSEPVPFENTTGVKRFYIRPGYYGGLVKLDAERVLRGADIGTFGGVINVDKEINDMHNVLQQKGVWTRNYIRARLAALGSVSATKSDGTVIEVGRWENWANRNAELSGDDRWNQANSDFIESLRSFYTYFEGNGFVWDNRAVVIANPKTWHKAFEATAIKSNYRDRLGSSFLGVNDYNRAFEGSDLPRLVADYSTYKDANGTAQPNIPEGYAVCVGYHDAMGIRCGDMVLTRNVDALGEPGLYVKQDRDPAPEGRELPYVKHTWAGGARINYLSQIQVVKVYTP